MDNSNFSILFKYDRGVISIIWLSAMYNSVIFWKEDNGVKSLISVADKSNLSNCARWRAAISQSAFLAFSNKIDTVYCASSDSLSWFKHNSVNAVVAFTDVWFSQVLLKIRKNNKPNKNWN